MTRLAALFTFSRRTRLGALTVAASALCLLPALASAGDPTNESSTPPVDEDGAWASVPGGTSLIYVPDALLELADQGGPEPSGTRAKLGTTFLNFDGETLTTGGEDARQNRTSIGQLGGAYPAWGGTSSQRQAVIDAVIADWAAYNMIITTNRPASGEYNMIMIGPKNHGFGNGVLGIAPLDCNDNNPYNITYSFGGAGQYSATTFATTIGQEVAHGFGLEHVNMASDIMNPYNSGGNPAFLDNCYQIVTTTTPIVCGSQHAQYCSGSQQNSHRELLGLFGPAVPDTADPTGQITFPLDGQSFPTGADFVLTIEANDDVGIASVDLYNNGTFVSGDNTLPYAWDIVDIPDGNYSFQATVRDQGGNEIQTNVVNITVAPDGGSTSGTTDPTTGGTTDPTTGGTTGTGDSGTGSDTGGEAGGDDGFTVGTGDSGFPPGFGEEPGDQGCACSADGRGGPGAMLLFLLVGAPWLRRRR